MIVSHSPVEHSLHDFPAFTDSRTPVEHSSHDFPTFAALHQAPHKEAGDSNSRTFYQSVPTTHLYTNVKTENIGFGSQEGQAIGGYGVKEAEEFGEVQAKASARASIAYPYPFSQAHSDLISGKPSIEYGFGFTPSIYDFVSYH